MSDRPHPLDQVELRFGLGGAVLLLVLLLAGAARLPEAATLALLVPVTAAVAAVVDLRHAALLGATTWALFTGFVTHHDGRLALGTGDLRTLAGLVVAALVSSLLGRTLRRAAPRPGTVPVRRAASHVHGRAA